MHLIAIISQMLHIGTFAIYLQLYVDTHTHTFIHTVYTYKGEKYNSLQMQCSWLRPFVSRIFSVFFAVCLFVWLWRSVVRSRAFCLFIHITIGTIKFLYRFSCPVWMACMRLLRRNFVFQCDFQFEGNRWAYALAVCYRKCDWVCVCACVGARIYKIYSL